MQRVVVDTNVFVSALIQRSYPYLIIHDVFMEGKIELCVSDALLKEYFMVFRRKKFSKYPDFSNQVDLIIANIERKALKFQPKGKLQVIADQDDNKLLELAGASKADFLITGNTNDFTMTKFRRTRIVSPKEYWEVHKPQ